MGLFWGCFGVLRVHGCNRRLSNTQTRCLKVEKIPNANIWVGLHTCTFLVERESGHRKIWLVWGYLGSFWVLWGHRCNGWSPNTHTNTLYLSFKNWLKISWNIAQRSWLILFFWSFKSRKQMFHIANVFILPQRCEGLMLIQNVGGNITMLLHMQKCQKTSIWLGVMMTQLAIIIIHK